MNKKQYTEDLKVMIEADKKHLKGALERGQTVIAKRYVDAVIGNQRVLEDLTKD